MGRQVLQWQQLQEATTTFQIWANKGKRLGLSEFRSWVRYHAEMRPRSWKRGYGWLVLVFLRKVGRSWFFWRVPNETRDGDCCCQDEGLCWVTLQEQQANRKKQVPLTSSRLPISRSPFSAPYWWKPKRILLAKRRAGWHSPNPSITKEDRERWV